VAFNLHTSIVFWIKTTSLHQFFIYFVVSEVLLCMCYRLTMK